MAGEVATAPDEPKPIKILVVVRGGVVCDVLSSRGGVEVDVRDWDNINDDDDLSQEGKDKIGENDETEYPFEIY